MEQTVKTDSHRERSTSSIDASVGTRNTEKKIIRDLGQTSVSEVSRDPGLLLKLRLYCGFRWSQEVAQIC
jgi:hypothetical protein